MVLLASVFPCRGMKRPLAYDATKGEARRCTPGTQWSMTPCFALFAQIGQVESMPIITERDTDQSKGFAVVDMGDEDAEQVIAQLNGTEVSGRRGDGSQHD